MFCNNTISLENKTTNNFVNESYLFTQTSYIVKTYTTTAREPSIDACKVGDGAIVFSTISTPMDVQKQPS